MSEEMKPEDFRAGNVTATSRYFLARDYLSFFSRRSALCSLTDVCNAVEIHVVVECEALKGDVASCLYYGPLASPWQCEAPSSR